MPTLFSEIGNHVKPFSETRRTDNFRHMSSYGRRLKFARKGAGLTLAQLAKMVGQGTTTIANIELGNTRRSTQTVELAQALGVRPEWLETGREPMVQPPAPSPEALELAQQIEQLPPQGKAAIRALILAYGPAVPDERVAEFIKPIRSKR